MAKFPESGNPNPPENSSPKSSDVKVSDVASQANQGKARPATAASAETSDASKLPGRKVAERKGQYLITARRLQGMQSMGQQPLSFSFIEQTLRASPDIEVVDTVGPKSIMGALANGMSEVPTVLVARMTEQKAGLLHQQAQGRLMVERDQHLSLLEPAFQQPSLVTSPTPTSGSALTTTVTVLGPDNTPIKDAEVYLFGSFVPGSGVTDERGQVSLSLYGETAQSIRSLYVKPKADYWSFYQPHPDLGTDDANVVVLRPLSDWHSLSNFLQEQVSGWGQKAMRLDQLPENYRGQGIKVAVIDSGAATTHEELRKIRFGFDVINKKTNPNTWNEDIVAHGSHSAGLIAGADNDFGIRGFAPDAEVHVCKLFPGGQVSQLIDALEYCIEQQIDVVNLSLGGIAPSEILEQQILRAKQAGVACIVAAGNSGGRVQYPATSPNVLAVAAIGKLNEFPSDSYHVQTVTPMIDGNGFFSARFTCYGPEIAVCAPGVAITSSVPPNNYAALDGTSTAAPHVTGLAALVLGHHPEFQASFKARSPERVDRLFQIIKLSAHSVNVGDPSRTGFGLPDALVAVGLQPQAGLPMAARAEAQAAARAFAASPYTYSGMGPALGGQASQSAPIGGYSMNPVAAMYAGQAQLAPQIWFGNPWGQAGQSMSGASAGYSGNVDPAYAAYMQAYFAQPQFGGGMSFGYGMPPSAFGRSGW